MKQRAKQGLVVVREYVALLLSCAFVALMVYGAYFVLDAVVGDGEPRARSVGSEEPGPDYYSGHPYVTP